MPKSPTPIKSSIFTLCIDARFWGVRNTGIGRYIEHLIANLPTDPSVRIVLVVPPDLKSEPKLKKFTKIYSHFHPYSLLAQSEMFFLLWRLRPDLTHFTHFSIPVFWFGKFVVTIHDLIKHFSGGMSVTTRHPLVYLIKRVGYHLAMFVAVHRSSRIIVPAYFWSTQISQRYMISPQKIAVTYEGVSPSFAQSMPRSIIKYGLTQPYVMYTGNLYPHKNVSTLIAAIEHINLQPSYAKHPLILGIACARSVFEKRLPTSTCVKYLGRVPDEDLPSLYRHAQAFVFPSLIEGFGLTGLEAMASGCPVIAANASVLPEIYGSAALYFEPTNSYDLADKLLMLMGSNKLRHELIIKGKKQVSKYSWSKMGHKTWQIYQNALL